MVYLNYNKLNEESKERLFQDSKKDVEQQFGGDIRNYAEKHHTSYEKMIEEEDLRNLYSYSYVFNI
jgi:hypothetical protein